MTHKAYAFVATCIDFRFQEFIDNWILQNIGTGKHDRAALAGGVKDQENILKQIEISYKLHHIIKVVLINHEDCGAYGEEGTAEKHAKDLREIRQRIQTQYPDLGVDLYYLHLNGNFQKID